MSLIGVDEQANQWQWKWQQPQPTTGKLSN